jgi:hypothetical protein
LEAAVRIWTAPLILITTLGLSSPSLARDLYLPKHTVDEMKSVCDKLGGKFTQDSSGYECGTDCHGKPGTACTVFCKADKRCVAQVMGGRRPRTVESALQAPARH